MTEQGLTLFFIFSKLIKQIDSKTLCIMSGLGSGLQIIIVKAQPLIKRELQQPAR